MMSLPPLSSKQSASGITLDPKTLERIIPGSVRADGSIRPPRKVKPGFTPKEDIAIFRGTHHQALNTNAHPKRHIPGCGELTPTKVLNKNAKRRAKARANAVVKECWEDDEEDPEVAAEADIKGGTDKTKSNTVGGATEGWQAAEKPNVALTPESSSPSSTTIDDTLQLSNQLEKLKVK